MGGTIGSLLVKTFGLLGRAPNARNPRVRANRKSIPIRSAIEHEPQFHGVSSELMDRDDRDRVVSRCFPTLVAADPPSGSGCPTSTPISRTFPSSRKDWTRVDGSTRVVSRSVYMGMQSNWLASGNTHIPSSKSAVSPGSRRIPITIQNFIPVCCTNPSSSGYAGAAARIIDLRDTSPGTRPVA